ncbi:MAG: response regulator [Rubrivivax sp.]|nr:response regulator [Rubrivivax sp.]
MVPSTRIALVGFGRVEQAAFEAFFRVAGRRVPSYVQEAEPAAADFVIFDAADATACVRVRDAGLMGRAVALGAPRCDGALLQLARPLNLMQVVRALDAVVERGLSPRETATGEGIVVASPPGEGDDEDDTAPDGPYRLEAGGASPGAGSPAGLHAHGTGPRRAGKRRGRRRGRLVGPPLDHILVVDDSEVALRFMAQHLQRFGFEIHLAKSGEEALKRLDERRFDFVFLDVLMEGLDGFQTCKAIKRRPYPEGRPPPTVVMLTCLGGPADKLRGTMAGADAYLTKPLREVELLKVVGEREVAQHAYAPTAAPSTLR